MPAIPAAIIASAAISGGAAVAGAAISSKASTKATQAEAAAAKDASQVQASSAKDALDFAKQAYGQRRTDLNPYIGLGGGSAAKLADLMGIQMPPQQQATTQGNALPMDPSHIPPGQNFPASWVPDWSGSQPGLNHGGAGVGAVGSKQAPQGATMAGMAMPRGGGVQMQAPDGSSRLVPESLVPLAEARGAKRVGGV